MWRRVRVCWCSEGRSSEGALVPVRTLYIDLVDPPGGNCSHQEASRKEQILPRSHRDLLATIKPPHSLEVAPAPPPPHVLVTSLRRLHDPHPSLDRRTRTVARSPTPTAHRGAWLGSAGPAKAMVWGGMPRKPLFWCCQSVRTHFRRGPSSSPQNTPRHPKARIPPDTFDFPHCSVRVLGFVKGTDGKVCGLRKNGEQGTGERGCLVTFLIASH